MRKINEAIAKLSKLVEGKYTYVPISEDPCIIGCYDAHSEIPAFHVCDLDIYITRIGSGPIPVVPVGWIKEGKCDRCGYEIPSNVMFKILLFKNRKNLKT